MYVANTRSSQFIHAISLDAACNMVERSTFADLNQGTEPGIPNGLKVYSIGRRPRAQRKVMEDDNYVFHDPVRHERAADEAATRREKGR
jgi:hypothetical protein